MLPVFLQLYVMLILVCFFYICQSAQQSAVYVAGLLCDACNDLMMLILKAPVSI